MKQIIALLLFGVAVGLRAAAPAPSYSTEATLTVLKEKGQYEVLIQIMEIVEQRGKATTNVLSAPRIQANLGQEATCFVGANGPKGETIEGVNIELFCPKPGEGAFASCKVTVKRRGQVVSRSQLRLKLEEK